jgi:hypothetical protein
MTKKSKNRWGWTEAYVTPSVSSGFTITCVARRSSGLTAYSLTNTITINRFQIISKEQNIPNSKGQIMEPFEFTLIEVAFSKFLVFFIFIR